MTTGSAGKVSATGATLSASYSGAASFQGAGFYYGTSSSVSALVGSGKVAYTSALPGSGSGSFSVDIGSLEESTTYYYVAFMEVLVNGTYKEVYGAVKSFRTSSSSTVATLNKDWLEAPASPSALGSKYLVTTRATMNGKNARNYSILYDPSRYASLWTAYVLCAGHQGTGSGGAWNKNPQIPESKQSSVEHGYPSVGGLAYDRGHQIPNADRNGVSAMRTQTYYWTNSTPQLATFNQGIWNTLENQVRAAAPSSDSLYVVPGPVYQTVGGNETVKTFTNSTNDDKTLPIPNYYYKVVLKVHRSGGTVTGASAIGFWFSHEAHKDENWQSFAVSVDEVEQKTGFDFFANLPPDLEAQAEQNTSWSTFRNF